jgi:hypothetical protein
MFVEICARDPEGIGAKLKLGIYKDDGNGWLKIKNRWYSQMEGRHELLTVRSAANCWLLVDFIFQKLSLVSGI